MEISVLSLVLASVLACVYGLDPPDYMAAIFVGEEPACGAGFITKDRLVTAAHCVFGKSPLEVSVKKLKPADNEKLNVEGYYVHPYYRPQGLDYDIAVVKVANYDAAQVLTLAESEPAAGQQIIRNSWNLEDAEQKLEAEETTVVERATCRNTLQTYLTLTGKLMCTDEKDAVLPFVEGSPLMLVDAADNQKRWLYGVATWSHKEFKEKNLPNVYVSIGNAEVNSFLKMFV